MAVHQYIGARYVPGFKGLYSATTVYEALDVVDDGLGTTYIAKVPTPAGTPLTDTNYWTVYGSSNGAIISLQNRMSAVENDLTNDVHPAIDALERNIIVIGNSYVSRGVGRPLERSFKNAYEYQTGGIGFLPYTGHTTTFEDMLDNAIADTTFDNDTITDILFVSAVGDTRAYTEDSANCYSSLKTALGAVEAKITANFTNIKRVCVTLAETRNRAYFSSPANTYNAMFVIHSYFKQLCNDYGMEYIGWSGFNSLYVAADIDSDDYHPTTSGAAKIGAWIESAYFGHAEYIRKRSSGSSLAFALTSGSTITYTIEFGPEQAIMSVRRVAIAAGAVTAGQDTVLIDTESNQMPAPPPSGGLYQIYDCFRNVSTGAVNTDILNIKLQTSSHGTLEIVNGRVLSEATMSAATVQLPIMASLTYRTEA